MAGKDHENIALKIFKKKKKKMKYLLKSEIIDQKMAGNLKTLTLGKNGGKIVLTTFSKKMEKNLKKKK